MKKNILTIILVISTTSIFTQKNPDTLAQATISDIDSIMDPIEEDNRDVSQIIIIRNKRSKEIYLYENNDLIAIRISANSFKNVNCSNNYSYKINPNSTRSAINCYKANSGCGETVTIN